VALLTDKKNPSMNEAMASKVNDMVAEIAAGLASPRVVPAIDKAIAEFQQAQLSLYELRKAAVRLHGDATQPAPVTATAPSPPPVKASPEPQGGDLTMAALAESYKSHADSPYRNIRYRTKESYNSLIKRIIDDCGHAKLADLKARDIQTLYEGWMKRGKTMGHALATMLRALVNFGAAKLGDSECERLAVVLHNMRFKVERSRSERLTAEQATEIIYKAHQKGLHSIAVAQAFQFDCMLMQKDVVGEWVPLSELGTPSDVIDGNMKWLHGIRWSEIDDGMILRHVPSRGGKPLVLRLSEAPHVMAEFERIGTLPKSGPIIVYEKTKKPYLTHQFRREWRLVADDVGIPKHVKNMDSRPPLSASAKLSGESGLSADAQVVRATEGRPL
jgi:hypothetical protein